MSIRNRRGLVAAMEELDQSALPEVPEVNDTSAVVDPEVGEPHPEQVETEIIVFPEADETPEAAQVELVEQEVEVQDTEDQIEDAQEVAEQLEDTADIVERSNENGGLDKTGAELLNATLEGLYDRVGLRVKGKIMPSIEEFGGLSSRMRATRVSVEEIRQTAKKIWDQIIQAVTNFWAKIVEFLKSVFIQTDRYRDRIKKLTDIASKVPDTIAEQTVDNARVASALAMNGGPSRNLASDMQASLQILTAGKQFADGVNTSLTRLNMNEKNDVVQQTLASIQDEATKEVRSTGLVSVTEGSDAVSKPMLGNKRFRFVASQTKAKFFKISAKVVLESTDATREVSSAMPTLDKQACAAVTKQAEGFVALVEQYKDVQKKIDQTVNAFKARLKARQASAENDEAAQALSQNVMPAITLLTYTPRVSCSYAMTTAGAALTYVEKSLQNHIPHESISDKANNVKENVKSRFAKKPAAPAAA